MSVWAQSGSCSLLGETAKKSKISMVMFDLSGTTVYDDTGVRDCLVDCSVHVACISGERGRPAPYMIFYAMEKLDIQSVHEVIKIGDTPADMLEGRNAGCRGVVGVLSGSRPVTAWGKY